MGYLIGAMSCDVAWATHSDLTFVETEAVSHSPLGNAQARTRPQDS